MFSTLCGNYFPFQMHFKMSSAICFNLDQSKILSSGNRLKHECQFLGHSLAHTYGQSNDKSFRQAESRKQSVSCQNLF